MEPSATQNRLTCKVCEQGEIIRGNKLCEACLSFYKRNRNRRDLPCKNGQLYYRCDADEDSMKHQTYTRSGAVWRFLCPACRLDKCRRIWSHDDKNGKNNNHAKVKIDINTDSMFLNVLKSFETFNKSLEIHLNRFTQVTNDSDFVRDFFNSLKTNIEFINAFAVSFPFYKNLDVNDRKNVFLNTRLNAVVGQGLIGSTDYTVANFSSFNFKYVTQFFKGVAKDTMTAFDEQALKSWRFIQSLHFTEVEKAFFLTFLVFDCKSMKFNFHVLFFLILFFFPP